TAPAASGSASPPNLSGGWIQSGDASNTPWELQASGPGLSNLHMTWHGSGAHSGLAGSFQGTLSRQNGTYVYSGKMHVDEGSVHADGAMVIAIVSGQKFLMSY